MSYWVSVVTPQSKGKYRHMFVDKMHMSISWNYSDLLSALPCGWERLARDAGSRPHKSRIRLDC